MTNKPNNTLVESVDKSVGTIDYWPNDNGKVEAVMISKKRQYPQSGGFTLVSFVNPLGHRQVLPLGKYNTFYVACWQTCLDPQWRDVSSQTRDRWIEFVDEVLLSMSSP